MFKQLFSLGFWFHIYPPLTSSYVLGILVVFFVALLATGLFVYRCVRKCEDKHAARGKRRLAHWFLTWAILGLFWTFFTYERINLFGSRFWLLIGFIVAVVWLVFIILYRLRVAPKLQKQDQERAEFEKYLPKKKQ